MIVRVLKTPAAGGKDEDGREVGDDWLLADFGCAFDDDGVEYCFKLTTDGVRASDDIPFLEPEPLARWIADRVNEEWKRQKAGGTNVIRIIDLALTKCPDCGLNSVLDVEGQGEEHHTIWCEECGWEGKVKELMR